MHWILIIAGYPANRQEPDIQNGRMHLENSLRM